MKKFISASLALVLSGFLISSSHADNFVDEQVSRPALPVQEAGWGGAFVDDSNVYVMPSIIRGGDKDTVTRGAGTPCTGIDDSSCTKYDYFTANAFMPICANGAINYSTDCIESVQAVKADGTVVNGVFGNYFPQTTAAVIKGDPAKGIPDGWNPSIFTFPGITHAGGDKFLLSSNIITFIAPSSNPSDHLQLFTNIYPISIGKSVERQIPAMETPNGSGRVTSDDCPLWLGNYECAVPWKFPEGIRFKITVKNSGRLNGWVHGRINEPSVSISKESVGQRIEVEASPVTVPVFSIWKKVNSLPKFFADSLISRSGPKKGRIVFPSNWRSVWDGAGSEPYDKISVSHDLDNHNDEDFQEFTNWLSVSDNTAVASKSQWAFYTNHIYPQGVSAQKIVACSYGANTVLAGVVTTNATMYLANPPEFNEATQTLDYQVSSPHFDRNGVPNIGTYDLLIKSDVGRCIYGFTTAAVQASVTIVNASGDQQVASSTLIEKDGWLKLSVKGFGYSAPTLKVKLTQAAAPVAAPVAPVVATPVPASNAPAKKITITCVKGKTSKKVSAVKPVCPSGFKKK